MKENYSEYLKFVDKALEFCKEIPRYFSKFSNKIFCNHQKIILLVLKQKLRTTYRDLIEILKMSDIALHIRQKTKRFMKLTIAADTDSQLIMTYALRRDYKKCNEEFRKLLSNLDIDYALADKGYDSKQNRQFVINKLKAIPIIPMRWHMDHYGYINQRKKIDGKHYHQRSKVETVFSVIKKKYGSCLKARSFSAQKTESICKLIAYNIDRLVKSLLLLRVSAQPLSETFIYNLF